MKNIYLLFFLFITSFSFSQLDGNKTPTYPDLIEYYKKLDSAHKEIEFYAMGESDYGLPIFVCIINGAQDSLKTFEKAKNETTVLINNAIHPGEPDGVNACILWIEEWIKKLEEAGVGELLITSVDNEGTWKGLDLDLIKLVTSLSKVPVIAHGGVGNEQHIIDGIKIGKANAVAVGSLVVYQKQGMGVLINYPNKKIVENIL